MLCNLYKAVEFSIVSLYPGFLLTTDKFKHTWTGPRAIEIVPSKSFWYPKLKLVSHRFYSVSNFLLAH